MSGDVQPRKRKDKKKKKDELGLEEPRGTAAVLGEGDVFIHSQHEHGTGGHWCAKIIFFSLLAVLITLIGLIILENRGLTELEANSVESRYSGVLEGWLEDVPDDDHHDEHTLELKHPDDDHDTEDHLDDESDHEDESQDIEEHEDDDEDEEHDEDEQHEDDDEESNEEDDDDEEGHYEENEENDDDQNSEENLEEANDEGVEEKISYNNYYEQKYKIADDDDEDDENNDSQEIEEQDGDNISHEDQAGYYQNEDTDGEQDDDDEKNDEDDDEKSYKDDDEQSDEDDDEQDAKQINDESNQNDNEELGDENNENSNEENDEDDAKEYDEENQEHDDDEQEDDEEVEKIEKEVIDDEDSEEVPQKSEESPDEDESKEYVFREEDDEDFLEADDEPPVERIATPPAGKPFVEIEEEVTEKPKDLLAEEEEYEKRQEELRREEALASQIWLKLAVGGALLVATHAVLRRATAPRDPEPEDQSREETPPLSDRRMTLISQAQTPREEISPILAPRQIVEDVVFKRPAPVIKSEPILKHDAGELITEKKVLPEKVVTQEPTPKDDEDKELYSDEDEVEEEVEEEEIIVPTKITPQQKTPVATEEKEESEPEEVPDDVEIIDDEQIEDEEDEDLDEEEISDVDDADLLTRLEAKYGRLPEPERPGKHKEGGNSIEEEWPGEPSESYWREQLDTAEEELRQGALASCEKRIAAPELKDSARARWLTARVLDLTAEAKRDNQILSKAITAYLHLLKMNERLSDKKLLDVSHRTIDRIQFRGTYLNAEPIYRLLIRRFPENVNYRNNLTISFLMANRADLADEVLKETLRLWPDDRIALAHHGFVLKNHYNKFEEAVVYLKKALDGDAGPANEPRFYYHLGDALLLLGRTKEAQEVHERGAALGHFLSPAQRSLYNVPRLRGRPWWPVEETPYVKLVRNLERSWREILKEAEEAKALYEQEKEGLKERGEWSQLDLFARGREIPGRCARAPVTCGAVRGEMAAAGCRRGQVKFSAMAAGTHVRAHVGPTNCRLRMHLALTNTDHTYLRVHDETRQWQVGKTFIFDDSFEHEVWHNGTGTRLVLIVDVWHPDLTPAERQQLPAI